MFVVYVICVFLNIGFLLSVFTGDEKTIDLNYYNKEYRYNLGITLMLSLIPLTWFLTIFLTGFYEKGWRIKR